jgi:hypothetical protein
MNPIADQALSEMAMPSEMARVEHQSGDGLVFCQQLQEDRVVVPSRPQIEAESRLGWR